MNSPTTALAAVEPSANLESDSMTVLTSAV